jgi:hypothetical protein
MRQTFDLDDGQRLVIRDPGGPLQFRDGDELPDAAAVEAPDRWQAAMLEHGLVIDRTLVPEVVAPEAAVEGAAEVFAEGMLQRPDSDEPHVEIAVTPPPDHTLLLMVQKGDIVQWFLPLNASRLLPVHAGMLRAQDVAVVPDGALRFMVPRSLVSPSPAPEGGAVGGAEGEGAVAAASFGSFFKPIMRLIRIPIVQELVDAAATTLAEFIARNVDTKAEGFRFFDAGNNFPFATRKALAQMSGQRVLLLTHGIFSSLQGAFDNIKAGPVINHLRGIYGPNIIGWDHRTIAKRPKDNADEMLSALPSGIKPDFICHSRGALVMRAALEHPDLQSKLHARFNAVGTGMFVAGANHGSQLASFQHVNTLLNVYSAIGSLAALGGLGIAAEVIVGLLKVFAHGAARMPSVHDLSTDSDNSFVAALDQPLRTTIAQVIVTHANYDPTGGPLAQLANLNIDRIFGEGNDYVVPFSGAGTLDTGVRPDVDKGFGTPSAKQGEVMHTTFFANRDVQQLIMERFVR